MDDIAVIGLGLRFPGDATSPDELWNILENGTSQWSEIPRDRLNIDGYYHPGGERQGSISFRGGHFLKGKIAAFDAPFFSIAAADAEAIDPQQRLLLEVCYEALESAGCTNESIDGTDTSVFVGSFVKDYEQICLRDPDWQPQYAATGNGIAIMANRISYFFNLRGPSMTIDTGCSGSLVSVHLAAQSLRSGESSLAIAAGAGLILTPNTIMPMTALNFLSPDGKCFTFDARANGYGRGEGVGVVILKRMSDAIRDNDTIRAVIRGTQVNQDGRTTGITLPSKEAQVANIRAVYKAANLPFGDTAYVECHGTGTQAGDWRELKAVSETLGSSRTQDNPIFVGSIKPNIGHLEGAAGVAGLIKAVLMLERERIPPHINFQVPNPDINFADWKVQVSLVSQNWPAHSKKRVSVNCFGFGGTNAHAILDSASEYISTRQLIAHHSAKTSPIRHSTVANGSSATIERLPLNQSWYLFCYSSPEHRGIKRTTEQHADMLDTRTNTEDFLPNYAYTLGCRRSQFEWKSFYIAESISSLASQLRGSEVAPKRSTKDATPKLCFLFCGQGSQWSRMGADLRTFPVFWNSLNSANWYLKTVLGSHYDLIDEILKKTSESRLSDPRICQPATTAVQVALVDLLKSFAIEPDFVVGHSSGEIAAAFASGAISREDAWEIAYYRGLAADALRAKLPDFHGGMMAVSMGIDEATLFIQSLSDPLEIACINSPKSVTMSGKRETIERASSDLTLKGIQHRILNVEMAYHSSHMKTIEDEYVSYISSISSLSCRKTVRMFSSVTGGEIDCSKLDAGYWGQNMVSTVQFSPALEALMAIPKSERPSVFLEMGPSTVLRVPALDTLPRCLDAEAYLSVLDKRRPGMSSVLGAVGSLWAAGYSVNLKNAISRRLPQRRLKCLPDLPAYPWNHTKSYWHESHLSLANRFREYGRLDLIGAPTADSVSLEPRWRGFIRVSENPWIQDHEIQKTIIYPAAGLIAMVLEGARQLKSSFSDIIGYEIRCMSFDKAIIVPNTMHGVEVALNMRAEATASRDSSQMMKFSFSIYSKALSKSWVRNSTGELNLCPNSSNWETVFRSFNDDHGQIAATCTTPINPRQLYEHLETVGISYGPLFRNIEDIKKDIDRCISRVRVPDTKSTMPANFEYPHLLHPATLDSMFQTLFALDSVPKIPHFLERIFVSDKFGSTKCREFLGYAVAEQKTGDTAEANISMRCTDHPMNQVIINGLHFSGELFSSSSGSFLPSYRNLATELVWRENFDTAKLESLRHAIRLLSHKFPKLSVLQIGNSSAVAKCILASASGGTTQPLRIGRYTFISPEKSGCGYNEVNVFPFEEYLEYFSDVSFITLNYHVVVVCDESATQVAEAHLKDGGLLLQLSSGLKTPSNSELSSAIKHMPLGYEQYELGSEWRARTQTPTTENGDGSILPCLRPFSVAPKYWTMPAMVVLLLPEHFSNEIQILLEHFQQHLNLFHPGTTLYSVRLRAAADDAALQGQALYISLLDFDSITSVESFIYKWSESDFESFHALQRKMKTLVWVTRSANMEPTNPHGASVIGLVRTLMSEDLQKRFVTFDLDENSALSDPGVLDLLFHVCRSAVGQNGEPNDTDFAEKNGRLFIPRLETLDSLNRIIESGGLLNHSSERNFRSENTEEGQAHLALALESHTSGSPAFAPYALPPLGPGEIEIMFQSAVLFGLDGTATLQDVASYRSFDVVGKVAGSREDTARWSQGDKVSALIPSGQGLCTTVRVSSDLVMKHKRGFVPSHFFAAYYALFSVGRLRPGNTVLVCCGASGFGLAAIELCLLCGFVVFSTVSGPQAKVQRQILQGRGIEASHIFDGSDDGYISVVNILTGGRGVDFVYNPTNQDIHCSATCARRCKLGIDYAERQTKLMIPGGTLVHFSGPSNNSQIFDRYTMPTTVVSFDLEAMLADDPDSCAVMLQHVSELTSDACLEWICDATISREFDISDLSRAQEDCQELRYLGSVSVAAGASSLVQVLSPVHTKSLHDCAMGGFTYVLVGGLGGLGKSITELLVANGATHIAFISRSGASSPSSISFLEKLTSQGIDARAFASDVCNREALQQVFENDISGIMPPVAGVFHCAAVIKDAVFDNMSYEGWVSAFRPKAVAALNLVEACKAAGFDPFYVFLASSAGVIGTRGQANYAAGNSFLDALARSLRIGGKRAVSLDLGPILGAGMLAEDETIMDILRASGFYGIRHCDFLTVVKHAITQETLHGEQMPPQVILGVGTGGLMLQNQPADPYWSRTAMYAYLNIVDMPKPDLTAPMQPVAQDIKSQLKSCPDADTATTMVCSGLSSMLAKSMSMTVEEIDSSRPPSAYGVDSLVAVGVRNWVAGNCQVDVSVFEIMSEMTVFELSKLIVQKAQV